MVEPTDVFRLSRIDESLPQELFYTRRSVLALLRSFLTMTLIVGPIV